MLAAISPLLAHVLRQPQLAELLFALAGILSFTGVNWFYDSLLQKELEFRKRFLSQLTRTVAYAITAVALAYAGAGVWSLVIGFAAGHLANGITMLALTPYRIPFSFDRRSARELVRTGRGFILQDSVDFAQQNIDYLTIGRIVGVQQLGYYTLAFRQAEMPHLAIGDPVSRVTFPGFAKMRQRGEDVGPAYLTALAMVALAVLPLGVILSGAADPFVRTFFGDKWLPMIGVLSILGIWGVVRPLEVTAGWMLNAMGYPGRVGRITLILLILFVPAVVLGADHAGIQGVAWVMLGQAVVALVVQTTMVHRFTGVTVARQWRVLVPLFAAAVVSWVVARGLAEALAAVAPFLALVACSAGALAAYIAIVRVLQPDLLRLAGEGRCARLAAVGRSLHR